MAIFEVTNRTAGSAEPLTDVAVQGDAHSRFLSFSMPRMFDGIDLSAKSIYIKFVNAAGHGDKSEAENIVTADQTITFDWVMNDFAAATQGKVEFLVEVSGYENGRFYCWNTKPAALTIERGLDVDGEIEKQYPSILQTLALKLDAASGLQYTTIDW